MQQERLDLVVLKKIKMPVKKTPALRAWRAFISKLEAPKKQVSIGLIGKYVELVDAYKSIIESLIHAGTSNNCKVNLKLIHSEQLNSNNVSEKLSGVSGIIVAPGFGDRGIDGKIAAISYVRKQSIPFFGICLGMQCAVIEFARHELGLNQAHSTEMQANTPHPIIDIMEEQKKIHIKGGTMRLGSYPCKIAQGSIARKIYKSELISERHRHRYEFNNQYLDQLRERGMMASGINPETGLVEIIELKNHSWFIGVQFHPEYKSTVDKPHPLFIDFVRASIKHSQ